jgi:hypothetical protein
MIAKRRSLRENRDCATLALDRALRPKREKRGEEKKTEELRSVPRHLSEALVQEVEKVSERFAHLLHITIALAFDDGPPSTCLVGGKSLAEYVAAIDYRRIVSKLRSFKCCHPSDLTSLFALVLLYLRQMKRKTLLPLLEQMIVWFDVCNVLYCVAFLAHVWLLDDSLPLSKWHGLAEGVVKGVNLNKCVRNCLRILKHQLYVSPQQIRAALLSLEYGKQCSPWFTPPTRRYSPARQRAVQEFELKRQRSASRLRGPFGPR